MLQNLVEKIRQSDDPDWAAALRRICLGEPTLEDIEMLNSRVGASILMVVRRHNLRDALNKERLQKASQSSDIPIAHCLANIQSHAKMSLSEAYNVKGGRSKVQGDGILSVTPGAPLLITQNIDIPLGISNFRCFKLTCDRPCQ
jgi:hypothetical protein